MKTLFGIVISFVLFTAGASNWYVRTNSAGGATGVDWNNAWSLTNLNSSWGSVAAGDTVWISGGTYTVRINPTNSGSAGNYITVKRPVAADSTPTSAAGWATAFDSQVIIAPPAGGVCYWNTAYGGRYFYFDGRTTNGISLRLANTAGLYYPGCVEFDYGSQGQGNLVFTNIEMRAPGYATNLAYAHLSYNGNVSLHSSDGVGGFYTISNLVFSSCSMGGAANTFLLSGAQNFTIEHCELYNNSSSSGDFHANLFEYRDSGNVTFRYNVVHDWQVEGFMLYQDSRSKGPLYVYGNVFYNPIPDTTYSNCCGRIAEAFPNTLGGGQGPIYFFNNTLYNLPYLVFNTSNGGTWDAASAVTNNIFWTVNPTFASITHDYNYANASLGETNGINGTGATPFVNLSSYNFNLVSNISSIYPRNKGHSLVSTYNTDPAGNTRGLDGFWDIGAFEYGSGGGGGGGGETNSIASLTATNINFGTVILR